MYGMTPMGVFFTAIFPLVINGQALCQQPHSVQKSGSWRCFPSRGILFSDGHSVFKVLSIDELP